MLRRYVSTALLTASLFALLLLVASPSTLLAKAVGVFATVTAIDTRTGMATIQVDGGDTFTLAKETLWKVGMRLQCDRVSDGVPHYLERCLVW
jgi:hypothetical protein